MARKTLSDIKTEDEAKRLIEYHLSRHGNFTHNILSLCLRSFAEKFGYDFANSLVDEYDLEFEYGIQHSYKD